MFIVMYTEVGHDLYFISAFVGLYLSLVTFL
jgi:hypothetical protein